MSSIDEKPIKNTEVCELLKISEYHRKRMVEIGLLDPPIETGLKYPQHTLSQVLRAQSRMIENARPKIRENRSGKKTRRLSSKLIGEIRFSQNL